MGGAQIVQILVGVLVMLLSGGVAWIRSDVSATEHRVEQLENTYHEVDKKAESIKKDVDRIDERTKRIEQQQEQQLNVLERIERNTSKGER